MSGTVKTRVRVQAGSSPVTTGAAFTSDTFQNMAASLGYGTNNITSGSSYGFNPLSRNHTQIEWMYRGSWLVRKVVDCPADDMTREGIDIESDMPPDQIDAINQYWMNKQIWKRLNSALKWARLYGGCICAIMIRGHDPATPLRPETISLGQFQGILVLDRWMVWPHIDDSVLDPGAPDFMQPKYYTTVADTRGIPAMRIHHSRIFRFDGIELPYWQRMAENGWGLSILEPMWDRMIAFDSVSQGAAQLVYKAHLRVLKIPDLRTLIATGGPIYKAVLAQVQMIRMMQTNEGLTVLDGEDDFQANTYTFAGLADMIIQFSQQISGSADIPMTRLFGQSPAGMNSTGDSDLRNYYDGIKSGQETTIKSPVTFLLDITHRSRFGVPLPNGFNFSFKPLWQLQQSEKSTIAGTIAGATSQLLQDGVFTPKIAMKEVRQWSRVTGFGSNITDEDIEAAGQQPPAPPMPDMPGADPSNSVSGHAEQSPAPSPKPPTTPQQMPAGASAKPMNGTSVPAPADDDVVGPDDDPLTLARINFARGLSSIINLPEVGTRVHIGDSSVGRSLVNIGGVPVVIETHKGERRLGYGWSVNMPADYGYIMVTNSAEGPREQTDAFVGPNLKSDKVWVIEQVEPDGKRFDEYKVMLGFDTRVDALSTYAAAFSDGRGRDRIGKLREMDINALLSWIGRWRYGTDPVVTSEAHGSA